MYNIQFGKYSNYQLDYCYAFLSLKTIFKIVRQLKLKKNGVLKREYIPDFNC